jgi:ABC-type molybdate transport system substrate-binding protein
MRKSQDRHCASALLLAAVSVGLTFSPAWAGTVTIAVTPSVADQVKTAAEAFEAAYPDDRVRVVLGKPDRMKAEFKGWPIQLLVSDDESLISWMEAREWVSRKGAEPAVHRPLAVVAGAETAAGVDSLTALSDRLRDGSTRIAILDPQKTDCGRRAQALLRGMQLGNGWKDRLLIAKSPEEAVSLIRKGKAHLGVLFANDVVTAKAITVQALSSPDRNASVHLFAAKLGQEDHAVAQRFMTFVKTPECQQVLNRRGYEVLRASGAEGGAMLAQQSSQTGSAGMQ